MQHGKYKPEGEYIDLEPSDVEYINRQRQELMSNPNVRRLESGYPSRNNVDALEGRSLPSSSAGQDQVTRQAERFSDVQSGSSTVANFDENVKPRDKVVSAEENHRIIQEGCAERATEDALRNPNTDVNQARRHDIRRR